MQANVLIGALLFAVLYNGQSIEAANKRIEIPLQAEITSNAGIKGQPVISYYTQVGVGTPSRPFKVQFDVSTNELFLPKRNSESQNYRMHFADGFECDNSSTCKRYSDELIQFSYMHSSLIGYKFGDFIQFGQSSLLDLIGVKPIGLRQNFLAIAAVSSERFKSLPVDGFFGLGPNSESQTGGNLLANLRCEELIEDLYFSLWFNPQTNQTDGGSLILGGTDNDRMGGQLRWHYLESLESTTWALSTQSIVMGDRTISAAGGRVVFNTSVSDLYAPRDQARLIYELIGSISTREGLNLIHCDHAAQLPNLIFNIDGVAYELPSSIYIRKTADGSIFGSHGCYVAILPSEDDDDDSTTWTLSTPFLSAHYGVFDVINRRVGLAPLKL